MDLTCRFVGRISVLDLAGALVVSPEETVIESLRSVVGRLIAQGHVNMALNVARLVSIDARGLGELVRTAMILRRSGGELVLVLPTARLTKMLAMTRLADVIHSCDSEPEAILRLCRTIESRCEAELSTV